MGVTLTTKVATPPAHGLAQAGVAHNTLSMAPSLDAHPLYWAESAALRSVRREVLVRLGYSGSAATRASAGATGKGREEEEEEEEEEEPERRGTGKGGLSPRVKDTLDSG